LPGDESRVRAGKKGAERPEFGRIAESPGWDSRLRIGARHIDAHAPLRGRAREAGDRPVGFKRSRLDRVDGHVIASKKPRRGSEEGGEASARAR